jgi:hypothetical protein
LTISGPQCCQAVAPWRWSRAARSTSAALERLADLYLWGDIERAAYKQQKAVFEAELSALVLPEQTAITEAGRYLNQVGALWDDADIRQRRELLHAILLSVQVDIRAWRVICVEPKPEFVPLFRQVEDLEEDNGCFYIKGGVGPGC